MHQSWARSSSARRRQTSTSLCCAYSSNSSHHSTAAPKLPRSSSIWPRKESIECSIPGVAHLARPSQVLEVNGEGQRELIVQEGPDDGHWAAVPPALLRVARFDLATTLDRLIVRALSGEEADVGMVHQGARVQERVVVLAEDVEDDLEVLQAALGIVLVTPHDRMVCARQHHRIVGDVDHLERRRVRGLDITVAPCHCGLGQQELGSESGRRVEGERGLEVPLKTRDVAVRQPRVVRDRHGARAEQLHVSRWCELERQATKVRAGLSRPRRRAGCGVIEHLCDGRVGGEVIATRWSAFSSGSMACSASRWCTARRLPDEDVATTAAASSGWVKSTFPSLETVTIPASSAGPIASRSTWTTSRLKEQAATRSSSRVRAGSRRILDRTSPCSPLGTGSGSAGVGTPMRASSRAISTA